MKKTSLLLFVLTYLFVFTIPFLNIKAETTFSDVNSHWAKLEIEFLSDIGVIGGYPNGQFGVNDDIKRSEAAAIIVRELGLPTEKSTFNDVPQSHWALEEIGASAEAGIIGGYPDGEFKPEQTLSRQEMAAILVRAYELSGNTEVPFHDVDLDSWAYDSIESLLANDITVGYSDQTFRPENNISRAEFSVFLARVLDESFKKVTPSLDVTGITHGLVTTNVNHQIIVSAHQDAEVVVTLNNVVIDGENGVYPLSLQNGENTIDVMASINDTKEKETIHVTYQPEIADIATIEPITISASTPVKELELPSTIDVVYTTGEQGEEDVEWNTTNLNTELPGEYEITGDITNTSIQATVMITILEVLPTNITINDHTMEILLGSQANLSYELQPSQTTSRSVSWSSSNESVATVDQTGTITAISEGKTEVTATTSNGLTDTTVVTVKKNNDTSIIRDVAAGMTKQDVKQVEQSDLFYETEDSLFYHNAYQFGFPANILYTFNSNSLESIFFSFEGVEYLSLDDLELLYTVLLSDLENEFGTADIHDDNWFDDQEDYVLRAIWWNTQNHDSTISLGVRVDDFDYSSSANILFVVQ
ncbi:S-layer homology domain-containing protein [Desertibacillus haloalkaliphilus]|uniref:S-layer homology domain-containing protein n=1 Tax=Desertibacillus haloalkaliphilus TaxID=1328930 RepID=UPI001C25E7E2|nr:S-layer homology domain-containing protein [Desertibacillus haloalkaliphilus]MBU8907607.1 S-layer homology domain-containing protein [Desertibacillus haloalkaliphilus]